MRILVTGSAGHLGEALVRTLRADGHAVLGLDQVASACTDRVGSIADPAVVRAAVEGVDAVLHAATLHKPHIATHTRQDFIDTNVTGTLNLLDAAVDAGVRAFVFTSTTSSFGDAMTPPPGAPAAWITEDTVPQPKNIYGATKLAAEDLCRLAHRNQKLPCLILRTSRFFPEADDQPASREAFVDANLKLNEFLHRRVAIEDAVEAHRCAIERAPALGFGRYIISATTPFRREDAALLRRDPAAAMDRRVPGWRASYEALGWRMAPSLDRVYDNALAREALDWRPREDFATVLARVQGGGEVLGPMARRLGIKGYHGAAYRDGRYPVEGA
ncbi:NAD-dependent epimerase/dehydratase family protein [Oleiagrimonas soli]|uniref:NAD-dependent epimerase n=1 Tax=Oleiagrimonas soli TaxID=1543381 RepID=A0A099CYK9_9GAMM|nr:NAD(P)-dependent oxidoreductase [Oleiagrimonas soli]KGI79038.1 NAD-dependent epimerase [Oleiagrimonas soli]MBB6184598.1 UDP-glucose 4-epimerase [Oleiagrimonas soli]